MIDKLELYYIFDSELNTTSRVHYPYSKTNGLFDLRFNSRSLQLKCNPNRIYNEYFLGKTGNFHLINYQDFINVWEIISQELYNLTEILLVPHQTYITRLDICKNINIQYPSCYYIKLLSQSQIAYMNRSIINDETASFFNATLRLDIYDKVAQFQKEYRLPLDVAGNWLRVEIKTSNNKSKGSIKRIWGFNRLNALFKKDSFEVIENLFLNHINKRLFKDIILGLNDLEIKSLSELDVFRTNPYLRFCSKIDFLNAFPSVEAFKRFLITDIKYSSSYASIKAKKEYPNLINHYTNLNNEVIKINSRDLLNELYEKINEHL